MNFIQTFHIHSNKDPFRDTFGWAAPEYHLMSWALSCLQLCKIYGNITLYANSQAAHLLIDTLQLPYTEMHLTHDQLRLIHPDLWALPKLYTYSLQETPFLHIDGDVFLFNPFHPHLLDGELIAQNIEVATEYYTSTQRELMQYFTFFPPCVRKEFDSGIPIQAVNAGILGGNNLSFIRNYTHQAFEYINKNANNLQHINVDHFNVFFEQHLFYALVHENGNAIQVLFEDIVNDNGYLHLGDFHDVPFNRSYLHLLGHFKRDEFTCIQMANKLKELYPEYYYRIIALFHDKNIRLSPCGFCNEINPSVSFIDEQNNSHLQLLKFIAGNCPSEIDKQIFQRDFEIFYQKLLSILTKNSSLHLEDRDFAAQHWYRDLFEDTSTVLKKQIVCCREIEMIESSFNWAGLFNKYYRVGALYYDDLKIDNGRFLNLVVHEASDNRFSLYDIDDIDQLILQSLSEPLSINELLIKMQVYFEDDIIQNHYEVFSQLILTAIKQLVIKKAIQPVSN